MQVGIEVCRYGDAINTKLIFTLIGYMREDGNNDNNDDDKDNNDEEKGGVLVADDVDVLDEAQIITATATATT